MSFRKFDELKYPYLTISMGVVMNKYHINDKGVPGICTAKVKCQFGGDAQHYFSPEAAQSAYELSMAKETLPSVQKKSNPVMPTSGAYDVGTKAERYVHPQGKIVEINPDGSVTAWKNGKIIPTSATADKLRAGYGAWKRDVTEAHGERPVSDASVAAKTAARQARQLNQIPDSNIPAKTRRDLSAMPANQPLLSAAEIEAQRDNAERIKKLTDLGYPKTSGLDPRKTPGVEDRKPERDEPSNRSWRKGRAVLPTGDRVNPHLNPESNSYIQGWAQSGDQSVIAIVKQRGYSRDAYRSILSGHNGVSDDIIGDAFRMEHDQTGAAIGSGDWVVVGVYEPKPGGAVVGEIPNQKIPFYVYK